MLILNLAAGKFDPLKMPEDVSAKNYILNVDTSYFSKLTAEAVEGDIVRWLNDPNINKKSKTVNLNMDVFEFMERSSFIYDRVVIYRFLEHVSFTQVEYFIYLVSTVIKCNGIVDVIVPDYEILAQMLLNENYYMNNDDFNFQAHNILLTTELLNEPSCPHASIWTPERMKRFWELEGRFKLALQKSGFEFDGRNIYLRSLLKRL